MTDQPITEQPVQPERVKLIKAGFSYPVTYGGLTNWVPDDVDKMEITDLKQFTKIVEDCRFYYKRDPIASTVINKMIEIAITPITFERGSISVNEFRIFTGLAPKLREFMEDCALEFLISGLVVPEVKYGVANKATLQELGIKKYEALILPIKMWLRDPSTIKIKDTMVLDEPSYFVVLPEEVVFFIQNKGMYPDGTRDPKLYAELVLYYPEFVAQVEAGNKEILLENDLIVRRKVITGSPYPTPYLYPSLEALKHKRNLRRMDYALAARVIEAIQLIKVGNDEYPLLEGEESVFEELRQQMTWRNSSKTNIERIFQLFTNHTVTIEWVYPNIEALLNERKYVEVNQDIFFSLGFPRILTTGETERTQTSTPEFAMISPQKTMENLQIKMHSILQKITKDLAIQNGFKDVPVASFEPINLNSLTSFLGLMMQLYNTGNLSRTALLEAFGYSYEDEINQRKEDEDLLKKLELDEASKAKELAEAVPPEKPSNSTDNKDKSK